VDEQARLVASFQKMLDNGYGGAFEVMARKHGYHSPSVYECEHGSVVFPHWHRLALLEFETSLKDAHEIIYGNRSMYVPYFPWDEYLQTGTTPTLWKTAAIRSTVEGFGSVTAMQTLFGSRPTNRNARLIYDNGFALMDDSELWASSRLDKMATDLRVTGEVFAQAIAGTTRRSWTHDTMARRMETIHNSIHTALMAPMNNLMTAPYHLYFWIHHCQVDRHWQAYIATRASLEGNADALENEFATTNPTLYNAQLGSFVKADGTPWTSQGTFDTATSFLYSYDSLPDYTAYVTTPATRGDGDGGGGGLDRVKALHRATSKGEASVQQATPVPSRIVFESKTACGCDLSQPSFELHFFLVPKGSTEISLPETTNELATTPSYVGSAFMFGGMDMSEPSATRPDTLETWVDIQGEPEKYDVHWLFEQDSEEQPEDGNTGPKTLFATPTFWHPTKACMGEKPVPDASWVTLERLL